ncbi:MAG: HAMP domain-containing sensor histidine kinase [Caldilineales bacterium]
MDAEVADVWVPALADDGSVLGVVRVTHRLGNVYTDFMHMRDVVLVILLVGLLLGVALALILAPSLVRPLNRLVAEMQQMTASKELTTVPANGVQEMQTLVLTFNTLVERLDAQDVQRRRLLANLVHELGRPLGALKSAIDALLNGAAKDEAFRGEMLTGMSDEIVLLQRLLDDLARLYDKEIGPIKLVLQPVQPGHWLSQTLLPWKSAAQKKGLHWHADISADLPTLQLDPGRMAQAVGNLLSNAIKYTPAGGSVGVLASATNDQVLIRISDTGIGIPASEQAVIFTPFYRGTLSGRFPQGLGLGLSIARELILAHGGQLTLESDEGQGTTFFISLPAPHVPVPVA